MKPPTQVNAMLSSAPRQTAPLRRPATRIPTVCVVDPKADDYQGWDSLAQDKGAKLQIVPTAEAALRLARTHAIDLWVVNSELSGLSGFDLCGVLRLRYPTAPVYLLVDQYTPDSERQAWAAGATLFGLKGAHNAWLDHWSDHQSNRTPRPHNERP